MTTTKEPIFFETIRCEDEEVFHLEFHKNRIARTIGLNIELQEYIYPPSNKLLKCKVIYNINGIIDISYVPYIKKEIKTLKLVYDDNIKYDKKLINRDELNKLYNHKNNCDDIIIIKNGLITDTTIANIALLLDDAWYTPKQPLLKGTTRERLLKDRFIIEKDLTIKEYKKATKIALMNAMIGFITI